MPYTDNLVLMSKTIHRHNNKFRKWNEAFDIKCLKDNHAKTRMIDGRHSINNALSINKVHLCGVCSLRVKANSVWCMYYVVSRSTVDVLE